MFDLCEGKTVYMLTATPVNNSLHDLRHMAELFTRQQADYFKDAPLGIHSLAGHFRKMEKSLEKSVGKKQGKTELEQTNLYEAETVLDHDALFHALVVQRSRAYVKRSLEQAGTGEALFPKPRDPKVAEYSVKQTYGKLLAMVESAFHKDKPLFALPIYYPYAYYQGDDESIDPLAEGRQKQVVSLIRTGFLKRFESSAEAFTQSCWNLMVKLLAWVQVHAETSTEKKVLDRWMHQHDELINFVPQKQTELFGGETEEDADEDIVPEEMREAVEKLSRDEFNVGDIIDETILDLDQIATFLGELKKFKPSQDKKLSALLKLLKNNAVLKKHKVIIFTEFMTTARYLKRELENASITGVAEIDSAIKGDRGEIIRRFAPYYNGSSSEELKAEGLEEIRVLISTDVLSEGLNLQDATRLINYDLHWNPVRLMQRIGRVDRRMNPEIEARIIADHPDQKKLRGEVMYWNFLPPDELNQLLSLYRTVTHKTLRISKTFGIEGKKLLTPEDEYDDLKNFHESYEGTLSPVEDMHLEYQQLLKDNPDLEDRLNKLPGRVFSGREHPQPGTRAVFFCYARPAKELEASEEGQEEKWSVEAGDVQWYLYDLKMEKIVEDATEIVELIRSTPETERHCVIEQKTLSEIRAGIDKHIKNTYLKKAQAPIGVKPVLKAWMELN